jgi:hypothetical protein
MGSVELKPKMSPSSKSAGFSCGSIGSRFAVQTVVRRVGGRSGAGAVSAMEMQRSAAKSPVQSCSTAPPAHPAPPV